MKKLLIAPLGFFLILFALLGGLLILGEEEEGSQIDVTIAGMNVSADVLKHQLLVEKYCKEAGIPEKVSLVLAIMQVESGGKGSDVMQASESLGFPPNTLDTDASIKQGCTYLATLLKNSQSAGCDENTAIQSYNFGGGFIDYVAKRGKKYSFELAEAFAKEKSQGKKVDYKNPIAIPVNGGWRYDYGNMFYQKLVAQYLVPVSFDDKQVDALVKEALKYQGTPYVYGGASPQTGFDCSGLMQWCFQQIGISLPRTAQAQYEASSHLSVKEAKPGDLLFFHSTYQTADYITHVGLYVGNNRMFHAGNPLGYADISNSYWQQHLVSAGRVKK